METIAVYTGNTVIYWSGIMILLGIIAWFCLSAALYKGAGGRLAAMFVFLPLGLVFSLLISRITYCHCNYMNIMDGLKDLSRGSYVLSGVLPGVWLAAFITAKLGYAHNTGSLLDALAPGAALGFALFRLSALFNSSCRSKIAVNARILQRLPFASRISTSAGAEYRFAVFFIEFLMLLVLCFFITKFYLNRRRKKIKGGYPSAGNTALIFTVFFGVIELLTDSTRYDSCFMHFNHFVSVVQMFSALSIMAVLIYYSIVSVKSEGRRKYHWVLWISYFLTLAVTGVAEYMVQRHGNWYLPCYAVMTVSCGLMGLVVYKLYLHCCERRIKPQ